MIGTEVPIPGGEQADDAGPAVTRPEDAARTARYLLQRTSEPVELDGHEIVVSGSFGIATWPADGDDVENLLRSADTAMYAAKSVGRNNYQFYSEPMNNLVFKRLLLETKLRRAIESHEDLARKVSDMEKRYDQQFKVVFDAIRNLISREPASVRRIGFRDRDR